MALIIFYANNAKKKSDKRKLLLTPEVQSRLVMCKEFLCSIEDAKKDYFRNSNKEQIKEKYKILYLEVSSSNYKIIDNSIFNDFKSAYANIDSLVTEWNSNFVKQELINSSSLFDNIDGKSLDGQQRNSVVVDEDNNLILAGAGSGKTLTISAKVKYLVEKKNVKPEEILLISFTKKAAEEMQARISNKLKINVEAKTFHKLGLDIISQFNDKRPDIFDDLSGVINKYFKEKISIDEMLIKNIVIFFGVYLSVPKDLEEFDNLGEVHDYYKNIDFETIKSKIESKTNELKKSRVTIQGETVKSLEEVMIANFLYLNGVKYTYERAYPYEPGDRYRKQYRPDFYLDDYDIYLEHFGITSDNKVPWLNEIEEKKYLEGMTWKRKTHEKHGTILIETYSYYNKTGTLHTELDNLLESQGVVYKKADYTAIYNNLLAEGKNSCFSEFKKLVQTFIGLFKSRGNLEDDFVLLGRAALKVENRFIRDRNNLFLSIVKPIFISYQEALNKSGQIDFNDMINMASSIVKSGKRNFNLKYIIIDEYQDISVSRFNLIKELKSNTKARVIAVGDDWQSIYKFTGSDIDLFTDFSKHLGYSEIMKIENTYRNSQELVDIAGKFVMKNPKQLKKNLTSNKRQSNPIIMLRYNREIGIAIKSAIEEIVVSNGENTKIMLLGRNNFDINVLDSNPEFEVYKKLKPVKIQYQKYPDVELFFLTTHSSKGLEADNVIIINLENKLLGFPNKIADDPILSLVLTDSDSFDSAEERRLFYVAITRTRNSAYLIVPDKNRSAFVEELVKTFNIKEVISSGEDSIQDNPNCPTCQKGYLVLRGKLTKFLGCTNYPRCNTIIKNIEILESPIKCNKCGGYMVMRKGQYGDFYGCTNYPFCKNMSKINNDERNYKSG